MPQKRQTVVIESAEQMLTPRTRRDFLRALATGGSVIFLPAALAACRDDDDTVAPPGVTAAVLDLSGDTGILNYLYAIEQFSSDFYVRLIQESGVADFNAIHRRLLQDIRNHEFIHTESLRALLGAERLPELRINRDFGGTQWGSRTSILETAQAIEDLTVSAYNNAARHLTDTANLLLIGKIASVEGRHSAIVRDILDDLTTRTGKLFAGDDIVDENGLDGKGQPATPVEVLTAAKPYLTARLTINNPPA